MRRSLWGTLVVLSVMLSGCASYVASDVTAFQDWTSTSDADRTYAFRSSPERPAGVETRSYQQLVDQQLALHGFKLTPLAQAHYLVGLRYTLINRSTVVSQPMFNDPWWPGRGPYLGGGWWAPPPPPMMVAQPYPLFEALLDISIAEKDSQREVYNVQARHLGPVPSLAPVMPYLVSSALGQFPLPNGSVQRVRLPLPLPPSVASNETAVVAAPGSAAGSGPGPATVPASVPASTAAPAPMGVTPPATSAPGSK